MISPRPARQTTDPTSGVVHPARFNQHGAAVVIKVDTGEVLALVSNPGFDLNDLDARYSEFAADELNRPMFDRATELAVVPGSTVKPIVGSGSITDGTMTPTDKIQCKGVLYIDDKPQPHGHCWIYEACIARGLRPDQVTVIALIRAKQTASAPTICLRSPMESASVAMSFSKESP